MNFSHLKVASGEIVCDVAMLGCAFCEARNGPGRLELLISELVCERFVYTSMGVATCTSPVRSKCHPAMYLSAQLCVRNAIIALQSMKSH